MKFEIRVKQTVRVERYCDLIVSADTVEEAALKAARAAEDGFYRFHETDIQVLAESAGLRPE